jgi:hypothetical protein
MAFLSLIWGKKTKLYIKNFEITVLRVGIPPIQISTKRSEHEESKKKSSKRENLQIKIDLI